MDHRGGCGSRVEAFGQTAIVDTSALHTHTGQPRLDAAFEDDDHRRRVGSVKRGSGVGSEGSEGSEVRGDRSEVREV